MSKTFGFEIKSGKVMLSDPCYDRGTHCGKYDVRAKNGTWVGSLQEHDGRVQSFWCYHETHSLDTIGSDTFEFGVDSGQFGIFDSSIWEDESDWDDEHKTFYGKCCHATCNLDDPDYLDHRFGVIDGLGFVSSTGYGDGGYVGELHWNNAAELVGFHIIFIEDDGDEYEPIEDEDIEPGDHDYTYPEDYENPR